MNGLFFSLFFFIPLHTDSHAWSRSHSIRHARLPSSTRDFIVVFSSSSPFFFSSPHPIQTFSLILPIHRRLFQPPLGIIIIIIDPTHPLKIFPSPRYTYTQIYLRTKRFDFFLLDIAFSTWTFFFLWMFVSHSHSLLMFLYIGHSGMIKFEIT